MNKLIRWGQPNQTNVVKAGEWIVPAKGTGSGQPRWLGDIPDLDLTQNVLMTPFDTSVYFKAATSYSVTSINDGLVFDTATGILSGTPTNLDNHNPIVTGYNSHGSALSNAFNIAVTA